MQQFLQLAQQPEQLSALLQQLQQQQQQLQAAAAAAAAQGSAVGAPVSAGASDPTEEQLLRFGLGEDSSGGEGEGEWKTSTKRTPGNLGLH
jgi:hypothetical protein